MNTSESDIAFIAALLRNTAGFVLEPDKGYLLETRLAALLQRHQMSSIAELVTRLRTDEESALRRQTLDATLNNETTFFRDIDCFNALKTHVIPDLLQARQETRELDVISLACSTGQEPYSVAMLLADWFPRLEGWRLGILGCDISAPNLDRARGGRYSQFEINRGLPASLLVRHFEQDGSDWLIRPSIRNMVEFRELNLLDTWWPVPRADIVFLRNVMIYWANDTKRAVLDRVANILRPGGCLVLGGAETTLHLDARFDRYGERTPCCFRLV